MNKEMAEWLRTEFWPLYLSLCKTPYTTKWGAGDKGKAIVAISKLRPSKELKEQILDWIKEVIRHRKKLMENLKTREAYEAHTYKLRNNGIYCNKLGSSFINGWGWECDIPSIAEIKINKVTPIREVFCDCGEVADPVVGMCRLCQCSQAQSGG